MTRKERLIATLRGESVDRPPVSFYELNGAQRSDNNDPFNIYSHPSWRPLIELAREKTDRIVMRGVTFEDRLPDPVDDIAEVQTLLKNGSRYTSKKIQVGDHVLTSRTRQDIDVNTIWTEEHLLKNVDDLKLFLEIPSHVYSDEPDISKVLKTEQQLGDSGIVMLDTPDPLCLAASLFSMEEYTVIALTEQQLFHKLLEKFAAILHTQTEIVAKALPGRLWRIFGPEYASSPYLPPALFREYVVRYDSPMIRSIHKYNGFARIHSHGNLKDILDDIVSTGCMGLDPIEPPPQGDVELSYVRERYGKELVLFGNLEISDIENLPVVEFEKKVYQALEQGTSGEGRGFVLMPSACPYGRELSIQSLRNYEKMIEIIEKF